MRWNDSLLKIFLKGTFIFEKLLIYYMIISQITK